MIRTFIVDAFTDVAFKGNPAGVCLVERDLDEQKMLLIAQELGLSETAFVKLQRDGEYSIRYFSPKMEIPLCGHATLASAKVLLEETVRYDLKFTTQQELVLDVAKVDDLIAMRFPIYQTSLAVAPPKLLQALGVESTRNVVYNQETNILMLEIECTEQLQQLDPDFVALQESHDTINGVLVSAASSDDDFDFHSRYFWPWSGTNEDPVTGGTHTFLAPYWAKRLDKKELRSFQSSSRSGWMNLQLLDDNTLEIKGSAVIVFEGSLRL